MIKTHYNSVYILQMCRYTRNYCTYIYCIYWDVYIYIYMLYTYRYAHYRNVSFHIHIYIWYIYVCVCVYQINTLYTLDLIMLHVDCMSIKLGKNLLELQYNYIEKRRSGKMSVLGSLSCQGEWKLYSGKSVDILWDWKNEEIPVRTSNLGVWRWVPEETAKILPLGRDN